MATPFRIRLQRFRIASARVVLLALTCAFGLCARSQAALLNAIFQDHAVLQRDAPVSLWGEAPPGDTVTISLRPVANESGASASAAEPAAIVAHAGADGRWAAVLPSTPAGGPYLLSVQSTSGQRQTLNDVLLGDVFLCSGQSNMEMPVNRAGDVDSELHKSANNTIRMLTVARFANPAPLEQFHDPVSWQSASPATVGEWSAVCYYFARELQSSTHAPLGLLHFSWGGSNIRPWISAGTLQSLGGYETGLAVLSTYAKDTAAAQLQFARGWESWWRQKSGDRPGFEPWKSAARRAGPRWTSAPAGLGDWRGYGDADLRNFTGLLWYRTRVDVTSAQAKSTATLTLGPINQVDQTWINGQPIGNTFGYETERTYSIPAGLLHAGKNELVINIASTYGPGGLLAGGAARAVSFADGSSIALQSWEYLKVPKSLGFPPRAPWEPVGGLSTLYNGMIAPMGHYTLRGALWYQGESNTGEPESYQSLLTALMADWRHRFAPELPFLIVQLPNFGVPPTQPQQSGWAELRQAQRRAVTQDAHAGLAITIDIGDPHNLHPTNKQDVGRRLARAARHVIYGEAVSASGPVALSAVREAGQVVVTFGDVEQRLLALSHDSPIGFELCTAQPDGCRFAEARLDGSRVLLPLASDTDIVRVRYCWADSPVCTLVDGSGLPAGPFELAIGVPGR